MDVFELRRRLVGDFSEYAKSFMNIADERIGELVDTKLEEGLLWPDPKVQLNPAFERGGSVDDLVNEGILHSECSRIFRRGKSAGTGGAIAGAAAGRAVGSLTHVPGGEKAGSVVGGLVGGVAGGVAASWGSKHLLDGLVEDDAKAMLRMLPDCLEPLATDYMLSGSETEEFVQVVTNRLDSALLRDMFRSASREVFVYEVFEPDCEAIVTRRPVVALPEPAEVEAVLTDIANEAVA